MFDILPVLAVCPPRAFPKATLNSDWGRAMVAQPWTPIGVDATGFGVTEYGLIEEYEKEVDRIGKAILAQAAIAAAAAGVEANMVYVALTHPADAIVDYMDAHDVDLVVMASHGRRGIRRVFLGSQTAEVATRSDVPVLVVR